MRVNPSRPQGMWGSRLARTGLCGLVVALVVLSPLHAQQQYPVARLGSLAPAGGKQGSTFQVVLSGADLDDISALVFSHPGVKAKPVPPPPPDPKSKTQVVPPPTFTVSIAADVPIGSYEARAIGRWGVSNPRAFVVGDLAEAVEAEPNNDVPQAQRVEINTVINGMIGANTDVDYVVFAGKKDEKVVVHCAAGSIDSRLSPFVQLFTADGRQLVANHHYRHRDALFDVVLPVDGDFLVRVCQHAYQSGGADHFYRLKITTAPWIDAVFPPVVLPGQANRVTLYGRNLPGGQLDPTARLGGRPLEKLVVQVSPPAAQADRPVLAFRGALLPRAGAVDGFEYRIRNPAGSSNPVLLAYGQGPIVLDNQDNSSPDKAQEITVPCEVCGRIEQTRDRDWYRFTARQNEVYVLEAYADRLGAPLDLFFELIRDDNRQLLGEFDDHPDVPAVVNKFYTRTEDPKARFVVPADGTYDLFVSSRGAGSVAGPRHVYRLSIRKEQPDFRLVVVGNTDPSGGGFTLRRGGHQDLQVVCFRMDGFAGEVALKVEGLPAGVTAVPQTLGPTRRETALVLSAAADAPLSAAEIRVLGTAVIDGRTVVREGRPGCVVWPTPQNVPAVSRLADSLWLAVRDRGPFRLDTPVKEMAVPVGSSLAIKLTVERQSPDFKAPVQITRLSAPVQANGQVVNIPNVNVSGTSGEVKFQVPKDAPPGVYNLVFQGVGQVPFSKNPADKKKVNVQVVEVTPPVRLTVFDRVAELSVQPPQLALVPGGEAALAVKISRLHNYPGEVKLQLVLPQGTQGVSAAEAVIPPKANEGKLLIKAAANAKPASLNAVVRATATVEKIPLTQEAKVAIAIGKEGLAPGDFAVTKLLAESADGWRYLPAALAKGDFWRQPDFDDKSWMTGKAPLGDGEEEIGKRKGTTVSESGQSYLFRRAVDVPPELLQQKGVRFRLAVASDDTAEVYLNGQLADRDPTADHEYQYWNREVEVPAKLLRPGRNVLAVLVTNKSGSSDLYFDLELTALVPRKPK